MTREGLLEGKVAVVTGAASGIGAGIAVAFAREGARVALVDRSSPEHASEVMDEVKRAGGEPLFVRTDVSSAAEVQAMAQEVLAHFGQVDILVNCAGIFTEQRIATMPLEDWDRVLGVNLTGTFLCIRYLIGQMLERIPKRDRVELAGRQSGGDQLCIANAVRSQRARRLSIRNGHGLDSVSIPSLRIQSAQEKPQPASHIQHAAFAAEELEKPSAMALIAADPV